MTPRQRTWTEIGAFVVITAAALGGLYAYGASRESALADLRGDIKRLEEHDLTLNKRLDRFEDKLDVLIERGKK